MAEYPKREVQIYADADELEEMRDCHPRSIEILKQFIGPIRPRNLARALDVAAGDGRLTLNYLLRGYSRVDLFDRCEVGVKKAQKALKSHKKLGYISQATMQDFEWCFNYSAIFMVWCAGYLSRKDLISFLQKAKARLVIEMERVSRRYQPESFIFLLDNVLEIDEGPVFAKGQQVRSEKEFDSIFKEAGVLIFKKSERLNMPGDYRDVRVWALY